MLLGRAKSVQGKKYKKHPIYDHDRHVNVRSYGGIREDKYREIYHPNAQTTAATRDANLYRPWPWQNLEYMAAQDLRLKQSFPVLILP